MVYKHSCETTSYKLILLYTWVENYYIPSHVKVRIVSIEIRRPRFGLGRCLNLRMTWIPLGRHNSNSFKYRISADIYHTRLHCTPIAYGIKIYYGNNRNKGGRMSNTIRESLTAKNTPRENIGNFIKLCLNNSSISFP